MKNKKGLIISIIAIVAAIAVFVGAYVMFGPKAQQGTKAYTLEVVDDQGNKKIYEGRTDAEYLGELMDEIAKGGNDFTYEGADEGYGLYIHSVNGLVADYSVNCSCWTIYVNGEYGMYGADMQPVADGDVFTLAYEIYAE